MPKQRTREEAAAYMREYRARQRREAQAAASPSTADTTALRLPDLAALESPEADWRSLPPVDALVTLARALPDVKPIDGAGVIASRPGALAADDARWRSLAPRIAYQSLTANIAATIAGTD